MHDRSAANEAAESGPCMGSICGRKALPAAAGLEILKKGRLRYGQTGLLGTS